MRCAMDAVFVGSFQLRVSGTYYDQVGLILRICLLPGPFGDCCSVQSDVGKSEESKHARTRRC
jgi:hypothetical protein